MDNPTNSGTQDFIVRWNTNGPAINNIYLLTKPPIITWTNLVFLVSATETNTVLQFAAENPANYFALDDVSVTPVPALQLQPAVTDGGNVSLSWKAATGLVYQVQYTADLAQPSWTTLGAPIAATNSTLSVLDANAPQSFEQRFYRLVASP
jgi:hypothetical protein